MIDKVQLISEDLEKEIKRCWNEIFPIGWSDTTLLTLTYEEHAAFARHFAEWQKQQMMEDAADSKITTDGNSIFPIIKYQLPLTYDCKIGDKVKIIIIKENML